jgi:hypothetical protein
VSGAFALASGFSPVRWRLIAKVIAKLREQSQAFTRPASGTIHDHNHTSTSYNSHHATPTVPSTTPPHPANQHPRYPFTDPRIRYTHFKYDSYASADAEASMIDV